MQAMLAAASTASKLDSRAFVQHGPLPRRLMRLVPRQRRPAVDSDPAVWRALIGDDMISSLAAEAQRAAALARSADPHRDEAKDEEAGAPLHAIACGELVRAPRCLLRGP